MFQLGPGRKSNLLEVFQRRDQCIVVLTVHIVGADLATLYSCCDNLARRDERGVDVRDFMLISSTLFLARIRE